eukprot:Lankesteria_metandrocarpae@DN9577_c0_g1_i1.p1
MDPEVDSSSIGRRKRPVSNSALFVQHQYDKTLKAHDSDVCTGGHNIAEQNDNNDMHATTLRHIVPVNDSVDPFEGEPSVDTQRVFYESVNSSGHSTATQHSLHSDSSATDIQGKEMQYLSENSVTVNPHKKAKTETSYGTATEGNGSAAVVEQCVVAGAVDGARSYPTTTAVPCAGPWLQSSDGSNNYITSTQRTTGPTVPVSVGESCSVPVLVPVSSRSVRTTSDNTTTTGSSRFADAAFANLLSKHRAVLRTPDLQDSSTARIRHNEVVKFSSLLLVRGTVRPWRQVRRSHRSAQLNPRAQQRSDTTIIANTNSGTDIHTTGTNTHTTGTNIHTTGTNTHTTGTNIHTTGTNTHTTGTNIHTTGTNTHTTGTNIHTTGTN